MARIAQLDIKVGVDSRSVGSGLRGAIGQVASAQSSFSRLGGAAKTIGGGLMAVGGVLSAALTAPAIAFGVAGVRAAADFEEGMAGIKAATGASGEELRRLTALLRSGDMLRLGIGATAGQQGIIELGKAGLTADQIIGGGLTGALSLAAAGGIDVAEAATTATNAMAQFNLKAKDVPKIADILAQGANASTASVGSLAQALSMVGNVAGQQVKASLGETVGVLAAFDQAGLKGSDAGTSLKTMLMRLVPATAESRKEMQRLGMNFINSNGSFKSVAEVAGILRDRMSGLSDSQRLSSMQTMFGTDAVRAAGQMYNLGADGVKEWTSKVEKSGAAMDTARQKLDSTKGSLAKIGAGFDIVKATFGEGLLKGLDLKGVSDDLAKMADSGELAAIGERLGKALKPVGELLKDMADKALKFADAFAGMDPGKQKALLGLAGGAIAAGPAVAMAGGAVSGIGAIASFMGGGAAAGGAAAAGGGAAAAGGGLAAAAGPIGLAVVAAAGLGVGLTKLYQTNDQFKGSVDGAWSQISESVSKAAATIGPLFTALSENAQILWSWIGPVIVPVISNAVTLIGNVISAVFDTIGRVIKIATAILNGDWMGAWNLIKEQIGIITSGISETVLGLILMVGETLGGLYDKAIEWGSGLFKGLAKGIESGVAWVTEKVTAAVQTIRDLLPGSDARVGPLSDITASGRGLMMALASGMNLGAGVPLAAVAGMAGGISGMLAGAGGALDIMPNLGAVDASALSGRMGQIDAAFGNAALSGDTRYAGEVRVWVDGGNIRAEMVDTARGVQRVESAQGWSSARQGA